MDHELKPLQKGTVHPGARWRLRLVLSGLGGGSCATAMALVLVFYGAPFNPVWWAAMAGILVASAAVAALMAPLIEWVIAGYLGQDQGGDQGGN